MDVFKMRKTTGLRQDEFWPRIGITQSGGCRYEKGDRRIPQPVQTLLLMAYGTKAQSRRLLAELRGE